MKAKNGSSTAASCQNLIAEILPQSSAFAQPHFDAQPQADWEESSVRKIASGWLVKEIKNIRQKNGTIISYPRVQGQRSANNPRHWYWCYVYAFLTDDGWGQKRVYLSSEKVYWVKSLIETNTPIRDILRHLGRSSPPSLPYSELLTALGQGGAR